MIKEKVLFSNKECNSILELHGKFRPSMVYNKTAKVKLTSRISEESYIEELDKLKEIVLPKISELGVKGLPDDSKILK